MQRCAVQSSDQLSELLERFATVVSLGKPSAAEEVPLLLSALLLALTLPNGAAVSTTQHSKYCESRSSLLLLLLNSPTHFAS